MDSSTGTGRLIRTLGLLLYGVIGAVPYLGSPLVTPYPVAFFLWIVWVVGLIVAIRRLVHWPWAASITAGAALLFWVLFVQAGSSSSAGLRDTSDFPWNRS